MNDFGVILKSLFASIPYNNYTKSVMAEYEGYYSSVIYSFLAGLGFDPVGEDVTNRGRIDLTIKTKSSIIIIEFKVYLKEEPIKQIKERKYCEKYIVDGKPVYIIGISFDSSIRNISNYKWEKI